MATTLIYEDYAQDLFNTAEFPIRESGRARTVAGISAFAVPDSVTIELSAPDTCSFVFSYADKERLTARMAWPGCADLTVKVGVVSRRVFELHIENATRYLEAPAEVLPPASSRLPWLIEEPARVQRNASRNADIIARIISSLPSTLRAEMINILRRR